MPPSHAISSPPPQPRLPIWLTPSLAISIGSMAGCIVLALASGWGSTRGAIEQHSKDIAELRADAQETQRMLRDLDGDVRVLLIEAIPSRRARRTHAQQTPSGANP